jgi:hypothetical protein
LERNASDIIGVCRNGSTIQPDSFVACDHHRTTGTAMIASRYLDDTHAQASTRGFGETKNGGSGIGTATGNLRGEPNLLQI